MISFESVKKAYAQEVVLDTLSFKINRKERCGLVGRNGSGKTTILRMIAGEEIPDEGKIEFPSNYSIGYLTQHLHFSKDTLIEEASEATDEVYKAEKILFGLGFKKEDLEKKPQDFSGGYQLRIHLAKVLLKEPNCLLLDEPTNYLDIVSIRWFIRFLKNWQGELIVISHDRDFMDAITTHTLGVHRKKVRKVQGDTEKYYSQLLFDEEVHEKTRANLEKKKEHLESFITRFGAKASKATQAQSRQKALSKMPVLEELAKLHNLDFSFPFCPMPGKRMLEASDLTFGYDKEKEPLIQHLNLIVEKGDRLAIIGKNGRGKSTILRLLAQDLKADSGTIKQASGVKIGFFGQTNIDRLHPDMTIEEEIQAAAPDLPYSSVRAICGVMMFTKEAAKKPIKVLSGGEKSRVLLGKLLISPTNLLLLDEPTNHLDMESIEALIWALEAYQGAVILVTHSELLLSELAQKFVICHQNSQKSFEGSYEEFLEKIGWEQEVKKPPSTKGDTRIKTPTPNPRQIQKLEDEIVKLEEKVEKQMQELIEASMKGDRTIIATLTKSIEEKKKRIDDLFVQLEGLHKAN